MTDTDHIIYLHDHHSYIIVIIKPIINHHYSSSLSPSSSSSILNTGIGILGLICLYQGLASQYLLGIIPSILLFTAFLSYPNTSPDIIKSLQMLSIGINTYANIPQIILTFNQKKASWSWITAALSMAGKL